MEPGQVREEINQIVAQYLLAQQGEGTQDRALDVLLSGRAYDFRQRVAQWAAPVDQLQKRLANVNEKQNKRRQYGVYYTPTDVTRYMVVNALLALAVPEQTQLLPEGEGMRRLLALPEGQRRHLALETGVFDPTCGAGEFLLSTLEIKARLLCPDGGRPNSWQMLALLETLYGNDIDPQSTDISKLRLFLAVAGSLTPWQREQAAHRLSVRFTNTDFVQQPGAYPACMLCVGNPPYVEYGRLAQRPAGGFGNIFADVMKNALDALPAGGVLSLVVPLSYLSTARMGAIRDYVRRHTRWQAVLSFADRPDCLFTGVHQKLCLVWARKQPGGHRLYTSHYRHWYKAERGALFDCCPLLENPYVEEACWPKLANEVERDVFAQLYTRGETPSLYRLMQEKTGAPVFLNMRGTFFVKAFSFHPGSKEYRRFWVEPALRGFILCLLNSSLYYFFWTALSDCWHITRKELEGFSVPAIEKLDLARFDALAAQLMEQLERTKRYIGTRQTQYEYKHKDCFAVLDAVDDALAGVYGLTAEELAYVKAYDRRYRTGNGEHEGN